MQTFETMPLRSPLPVIRALEKVLLVWLLLLVTLVTASAQNTCSPPVGVRISSVLSTKMTVAWDASNLNNGGAIQMAWAEYPGSNFIYRTFSSGTGGEITGLQPGKRYIVRAARLCPGGQQSVTLGLGNIRALTTAEEQALCSPESQNDLCQVLLGLSTAERGADFIRISLPQISPLILAQNPDHRITVRYAPYLNGTAGAWQSTVFQYANLNGSIYLSGLQANTLYKLEIVWEVLNAQGNIVTTCTIPLNDTPTQGESWVGPVFASLLPPLLLDCSTPRPVEVPFPVVTGGCTTPRITFTDVEVTGCNGGLLRTWLAVDDCGRSTTITQSIKLLDTQPPEFVDVPANDITIFCGDNLPTETPVVVDNCNATNLTYQQNIQQGSGCEQTITRTWTATDACGNTSTYRQIVHVKIPVEESNGEDDEVPELPVACGENYAPPAISNNTPLPSAQNGQVFNLAGFPAKLKNVSGSNGNFSGRAKVRLPFGNKVVYCDFNNITVNSDKAVTNGTLVAVASPNFVMPDTGSVNFGGAICVPDPPALAHGFNEDGEYVQQPPYDNWQPGDPIDPNYDPNGFDANGFHRETGTLYNPSGCNQDGLDSLGHKCDEGAKGPYYWLHNNNNSNLPTTAEGIAFAAQMQQANPNIRALVLAAINDKLQANTTAITDKRTVCGGIRTQLNAAVGTLDRKFFFGENDLFLNEDMNLQFVSPPIKLQQNIPNRSTQITTIEEKHIELYSCDKALYRLKKISEILNGMKTESGLDLLVPLVLESMKRLTKEQVESFTATPALFQAWLLTWIENETNAKLLEMGIVMHSAEPAGMPAYQIQQSVESELMGVFTRREPSVTTMLASTDDAESMRLIAAQDLGLTTEALRFEFDQGFEYIGGIHRAFYLDAIAKARDEQAPEINGEDEESLLPIRIEKEIGGRVYTMLLDKISFSTTGSALDAYFILDVPSSGQKVVFKAQNLPFTPGGFAGGTTRLSLISDVGIRLNNTAKLIIKGNHNNTFVEFDCEGFKRMGIQAEVEFCRNFLVPLKPNLEVDTDQNKRVKAYFSANMQAWGEFIATLSMDRFALAGHEDYKWEVVNASLDFSDVANPPNFTSITPNYYSEFGSGSSFSPQWKGFFMERLSVTLPKTLTKNNTPITITADKLVIDDRGLTGIVSVNTPVLSLNNGNLDGWAYSIDQLSVAVVANKIQGGGFGGLLHIPLFKDPGNKSDTVSVGDCFRYDAKIITTPNGELYQFAVVPSTTPKKVDMLVGTATIDPSSSVKVTYQNDKFTIVSNLSGSIGIDGMLGDTASNTKLKMPSLRFENVRLSNQAPYIRGGTFGISGQVGASIGGFGLTITLPTLVNGAPQQAEFRVGAAIKLVGDTPKDGASKLNFGAATSVIVKGELSTVNGRQIWKYKDYDVDKIYVNASFKGVDALKGTIQWYKNDSIWGRGFRGKVSMSLSGLKQSTTSTGASGGSGGGGLGLDALAQFGKKDDYKYFFIDVLAKFGVGQVNLSGIDIRGIGGGVYYHMERDTNTFKGLDNAPNGFNIPDGLGVSLSGVRYTPSDTAGLGIKFSVIVATTPKDQVFNAGVTLEIRFNPPDNNGISIRDIALYGSAQLMAPIKFGPYDNRPSQAAPIAANLYILYDFAKKTLHGELSVFADVEGTFVGAGPNKSVGKAVIHFDPDKWYINVGTPTQPLGIKLKIPVGRGSGEGLDLFVVKSYLCVGTGIPPMPPLPAYVSQMTGASNFLANESNRATGKGFAMGASVALSTGDLKFLMFYGHLDAGLGFDVLLQKYDDITCPNNNNRPLGINGWYAAGQAWSYIDADLGVKFKNKDYKIMKIGAAAALQVKLPNPFWARGAVGGEYSILGGLVKGKCNFKFVLGQSCSDESENEADGIRLIEELTPGDNESNVEVNTKPTAYFGVPVNGEFSLYDENGDPVTYQTFVTNIKLVDVEDGAVFNSINSLVGYSRDKRSVSINTNSFLDSYTDYMFTVTVQCKSNNILVKEERDTVYFTTAASPNVIPPSNVRSSYPQNGMYNFYKNEWSKGYIDLADTQNELFEEGTFEFQFSNKQDGIVATSPVEIEYGGRRLSFTIPSTLVNNRVYKMDVVKLAVATATTNPGNIANKEGQMSSFGYNPGIAASVFPKDQILYTVYFRTSVYNKFSDKINAFKNLSTPGNESSHLMYRNAPNFEPFDQLELFGTGITKSLLVANLGQSNYIDSVKYWYSEMKELNFVPRQREVNESSLVPDQVLNSTKDSLLSVNIDLYEENFIATVFPPLRLENRLFSTFNNDFGFFKDDVKFAIQMECSECCSGCTVSYSYGQSLPTCSNNGPLGTTINCVNLTVPCCCCSTTNSILNNKKVRGYVYGYVSPRPVSNTWHNLYVSYKLPNGEITTPGIELPFKFQ